MLRDIFARRLIDRGPVSCIRLRMALEPVDDVGVEPKGDLLLDGTKERAALRDAGTADFEERAGPARRASSRVVQDNQDPFTLSQPERICGRSWSP